MRREGVEPVVAPAALPGNVATGISSIAVTPSSRSPRRRGTHAVERPLARERADVKLVEHELVERERRPRLDLEGAGVENAGRAAHALRLPARARVGPRVGAVEHEEVVVAGSSRPPDLPRRRRRSRSAGDRRLPGARPRCAPPEPRCGTQQFRTRPERRRTVMSWRGTLRDGTRPSQQPPPNADHVGPRARSPRPTRSRARTRVPRALRRRRACSAPPRGRT